MKRAGDLIGKLFQGIDSQEMALYGKLFTSWAEVVGTDIAAHSRILELSRGVLYLGVDHPGWMQMISMKKKSILTMLQSRYPSLEIRDLRLLLVDGVPEEELTRRFSGEATEADLNQAVDPPADADTVPDSPGASDTSASPPPAEFQQKLEKLRRSVEKKWK